MLFLACKKGHKLDIALSSSRFRLPELAPSAAHRAARLPRFQRAVPSTSLDKSAFKGIYYRGDNNTAERDCQLKLLMQTD